MNLTPARCCPGLSAPILHNTLVTVSEPALADGEMVALVSSQVSSQFGSSGPQGKTTLSLDHRKQVWRKFMDLQIRSLFNSSTQVMRSLS